MHAHSFSLHRSFSMNACIMSVLCLQCNYTDAHERKEYVYHVFSKNTGVNCWKFICVLTPKDQSSVRSIQ